MATHDAAVWMQPRLQRGSILIDLSAPYRSMGADRIKNDAPLLAEVTAPLSLAPPSRAESPATAPPDSRRGQPSGDAP
jgi:hypothetical protein